MSRRGAKMVELARLAACSTNTGIETGNIIMSYELEPRESSYHGRILQFDVSNDDDLLNCATFCEEQLQNQIDGIIGGIDSVTAMIHPADTSFENTENKQPAKEFSMDEVNPARQDIPEAKNERGKDHNEDLQDETSQAKSKFKNRRKRSGEQDVWAKSINKKQRMLGKAYIGYTRSADGIVKHGTPRSARQLGPACNSPFCLKVSNRFCSLFTEEERHQIFATFWGMSWEQKKLYVLHMVPHNGKSRSYTKSPSRRTGIFQYFLKKSSGKHQVCKKMFLQTLGLKEKTVRCWVHEGSRLGMVDRQESKNKTKESKKRNSNYSKKQQEQKEYLEHFLQSLPKMESHYCRKDTAKLYLEEDFKAKTEVYEKYKLQCLEENLIPLSMSTFLATFRYTNLALFKPRKDQCDVCCAFKMKQVEESVYAEHINAKNLARRSKEFDKAQAEAELIHLFTMDVEAVKLCPQLKASALYYKSKLQVHNFTIYNVTTHNCMNYLWNETEGELSASVFTTCIVRHLEALLETDLKPVIIYSDSCGYQNKNVFLANALLSLSIKYNVVIEHKYLEKGHTQMECDAVHSMIERRLKGRDIYLPTDYIAIIKDARKKPAPLEVTYLDHTDFLNYDDKNLIRYSLIRPGKNVKNELKVSNIRCLRYDPDGVISFKSDYSTDYAVLPQRSKPVDINYIPRPLYTERIKIPLSKWKHLQELKKVLPKDTHCYYDNIPYKNQTESEKTDDNTKKTENIRITRGTVTKRTKQKDNTKGKNTTEKLIEETKKTENIRITRGTVTKRTKQKEKTKGKNKTEKFDENTKKTENKRITRGTKRTKQTVTKNGSKVQ